MPYETSGCEVPSAVRVLFLLLLPAEEEVVAGGRFRVVSALHMNSLAAVERAKSRFTSPSARVMDAFCVYKRRSSSKPDVETLKKSGEARKLATGDGAVDVATWVLSGSRRLGGTYLGPRGAV